MPDNLALDLFSKFRTSDADLSDGIAAIKTLLEILNVVEVSTIQELSNKLDEATTAMKTVDCSVTSVESGAKLFQRCITLTSEVHENPDFESCREAMKENGEQYLERLLKSRGIIATRSGGFIQDGNKILTHSKSRVVLQALVEAARKGKQFEVFVTESRPDNSGFDIQQRLDAEGIKCTVILDAAMGFIMESVDFVMVGAEGVCQSGGIINKIGTYQMAMCAKTLNKPLYVCAESFKFTRMYPLNERTLPEAVKALQLEDLVQVPVLNQYLGAPATRVQGIKALENGLTQYSLETLTENVSNWLVHLVKFLRSGEYGNKRVARVLGMLLEGCTASAEMTRQVSSSIPQIISTLIDSKSKEEDFPAIFDCLTVILKNFRGPAFSSKKNLEPFIFANLDTQDQITISSIATCFSQLPQIGGSGVKGTNHKTLWNQYTEQLIASIRNTATSLLGDNVRNEGGLNLADLGTDDPVVRIGELANRYRNLSLMLAKMLSEPFPASKNVPVEDILTLCGDVLCLSPSTLSRRVGGATTEGRERQKVLPSLQMASFKVLIGLIVSCRRQLVPHGRTICKFALQVLQWSRTPSNLRVPGSDRPLAQIRCSAYEILTHWVKVGQSGSRVEKVIDDLAKEIFSDVKTDKDVVTLQKTEISAKKKKGTMAYDVVKPMERRINLSANSEVCRAALELLDRIIRSISSLTSATFYKQAQEIVLPVVFEVEAGVETAPIPFAESGVCRMQLYRVLEAVVISPQPFCPAPISYAIAAFSRGQNDPDVEVAAFCSDALASCERCIHPLIPTMSFPLETTPEPAPETSSTNYIPLWENFRDVEDKDEPVAKRPMLDNTTLEQTSEGVINEPDRQISTNGGRDSAMSGEAQVDAAVSVASSSPDHTNFDSDVELAEAPPLFPGITAGSEQPSPNMPGLEGVNSVQPENSGSPVETIRLEQVTRVVVVEENTTVVAEDEGKESSVGSDVEDMLADFVDAPAE